MLQAAQNCYVGLDERAMENLHIVEQRWGGTAIVGQFTTLNRIIQLCNAEAKASRQGGALLWGGLAATDLVNEFLEYLIFVFGTGKWHPGAVTVNWLDKGRTDG